MGDGSGDAKRKRLRFHHVETYSGVAIDGPMRGRRIEHYDRWYTARPMDLSAIDCRPPEAVVYGYPYQWSFSLGQWCMRY